MNQENFGKEDACFLDDYSKHHYSIQAWLLYAFIGSGTMALVGWVFYHGIIFTILLAILGLLYPRINKRVLIEKRRNLLRLQFKDLLYYLGSSLSTGKSVEQSFVSVSMTLKKLYLNEKSDIVRETEGILRRLQMNENIEEILKNFANRSGVEEIHHFADVFSVCKRTGGNLVEVIRTTSRMISEHIEIKQDIETSLVEKRQEQRILAISPIVMVVFITWMSGEFMEPLFVTAAGRVIMTIAILMIGSGILISNRIMKIRF